MSDDCLIVEAVLAGQTGRFEELVNKYKDRVYNMACRMTGSVHEGQDLTQEIFLLIYKNLGTFKGQSSLSTWIYRIALNRCLDWQRKQQRRGRFVFPMVRKDNGDIIDPLDNVKADGPGPEEQILVNEQYRELHKAIKSLPDKYQKVIILYHFQQMNYQEIAEVLDFPVRTVETQLYRGKQKLKELLEHKAKGVKDFGYVRS